MPLRIILLSLAIFLAFPCWAVAFQGHVQHFSDGAVITWGDGKLSVLRDMASPGEAGTVNPLAVRKAVTSARKQLLDMILATRIDSKRTVSAYLSADRSLAARVRGMVQNSPMELPDMYAPDGQVRVYERFRGELAELVMPNTLPYQSGILPKLSTSMEEQFDYNESQVEVTSSGAISYTGIIVDARELKVTPCLAPIIYGQDGLGAYGVFMVSRGNAIQKGVVAYSTTPDPAQLRSRVGKNPLIVKALNAYGSWRTDLIVSTPMAKLMRAIMSTPDIAGDSRVVIVLSDNEMASMETAEEPSQEQ